MAFLKLKPSCKDYLWGGHRLAEEYGVKYDGKVLAEAWELSCHPDGPSYIVNGEYAGKTLQQYIDENGKEILGTDCQSFEQFPVLIKFIDAKENLSIQVHPSDETAKSELGEQGKAEMWYVLAAKPHAFLYYGLNREVSKEELEQKMQDGSIPQILNKVEVNEGDCFFIHPGTIHAIGAGVVIAEIQQSSNTTFRVYDYLRKDKNGNYRELHVERGVEVIDRTPIVPSQVFDNNEVSLKHGRIRRLFECDYFCVNKIDCENGKIKLWCDKSSFQSLLIVKGNGYLEYKGRRYDFKAGDSIFVPAGFGEYYIHGNNEILMSKL